MSITRAQRRRLQRTLLAEDDIQAVRTDAVSETITNYSVAACMVLRDKFGFGEIRLERFLVAVNALCDSIEKEYVSLEDCMATLDKECNLIFVRE